MATCKFCDKSFKSEKTLSSHMCPRKRRWAEKENLSSRLGFRVFQRFYEITANSVNAKSFDEFIRSQYYTDFVKFGRYLGHRDAVDTERFIDFVIKNGVKLRDWRKPYVYETFLHELMNKEPVERALERTFLSLEEWAKENNTTFNKFFEEVTTNEATHIIQSGRISPWVLYLSESAGELLGRMSSEQGDMIQSIINPAIWKGRFHNRPDDVEFVINVLGKAGL
jgi:hypothetical protein